MLTPDYLLRIAEESEKISEEIHQYIIMKIIQRMMIRIGRGERFLLSATDKWQLQTLQEAGYLLEDIQEELAKKTKLQATAIREAFEDAGVTNLQFEDSIYEKAGIPVTPLLQSPDILRIMQTSYEMTLGELENFTRTTVAQSQQTFIQACDRAYTLTASGATSYTEAVREAVETVAKQGVKVVYPSGRSDTIETATLRAVRTGISQMSGQLTNERLKETGWDTILVSAHLGARYGDGGENYTNHFWWQGKFYSLSGNDKRYPPFSVCGFGDVQGIHGANCRHSHGAGDGEFNPFKNFDSEENRKAYDLQQKQRAMERRIRKTKQQCIAWKSAVDHAKDEKVKFETDLQYQKKANLLKKQTLAYNEFCEHNGLKRQADRIQVARFDRKQAAAAREASRRYENAN